MIEDKHFRCLETDRKLVAVWILIYIYKGEDYGNYFSPNIDRSRRNMEIYKWKWMVLGALGCMNNADF